MPISDSYNQVLLDSIASDAIIHGAVRWTIFSLGPFKAAYPNFPVGLTKKDLDVLRDFESTKKALKDQGVDIARVSAPSHLPVPDHGEVINLPETRIEDLEKWDSSCLSSQTRRKVRKCHRSGLAISGATERDSQRLHALYLDTIRRHRSTAKYSLRYFERLCRAASISDDIVVAKAMIEDEIAGFIVLKFDEESVHYLHGGYNDKYSKLRPGFFTMEWAIQHGKRREKKKFNFLTSPVDQPALRAYKESFGGSSYLRSHWDVDVTWLGSLAHRFIQLKSGISKIRKRLPGS